MAVISQPEPNAPGPRPSARERAAAAWGTNADNPGRCPAEWRRPGEVWHCDKPHGHRWRHHYLRDF